MASKFLPSLLFSFLFMSSSYALDGDMYDFFLPNGMKVILMEKHATPKIGLGVYYNVGSHDELWGQKGITPIIYRLVSEGTEKYPKEKQRTWEKLSEAENKRQKAWLENNYVVGTYEAKKDGNTYKFVLLDNGVFEAYDGVEKEEGKWKIVDRGIHVSNEDGEKDIWIIDSY